MHHMCSAGGQVQVCWRTTRKDINRERHLHLDGRGKNRTDATCVWAPNVSVLAKKEKKLTFSLFPANLTACHTELKGLGQEKMFKFVFLWLILNFPSFV